MDNAWGWGILSGVALAVFSVMIGLAPALIDRAPRLGWWCVILSPAPLILWNILWVIMANPPDGWRRAISLTIGMLAGAIILYGVTELLHTPVKAQVPAGDEKSAPLHPPPGPSVIAPGGIGQSGSGQQFIAPGSTFYLGPTTPPVAGAPPDTDHVYQGGIIVGQVFGARRSPTDATIYTFVEISHATQFNLWKPFVYDGKILVNQTTQTETGVDSARPQDGPIYSGVTARVIGTAEH